MKETMRWKRHGVVLAPKEAWESKYIVNFPSSVESLGQDRWRIWYALNGPGKPFNICKAEGKIDGQMVRTQAVLSEGEPVDSELAIGNLPAGWNPTQPIHIRLRNGKHRLYFWVHGGEAGVIRFLAAESENGKQYTVVNPYRPCLYHPNDRAAVHLCKSTVLGLTPSIKSLQQRPSWEKEAPEHLICNDATTVYQLPDDTFELYSASLLYISKDDLRYVEHDNAAGRLRVIDRWTSQDGLVWSNRHRVIECDEHDPIDLQFYHLAVTHTPKGRVGMLGRYRCQSQTMDIEWCFSHDGLHWDRPRRSPWIKRCEPGHDVDSFMIFPPASMVFKDSKWWLFYTAYNIGHNLSAAPEVYGEPTSAIMLATIESIL